MSDLFDEIIADVERETRTFVDDVADDLKQKVSIPIEIRTGPRGGRVIIRSRPGEYPRKETGRLQSEIAGDVIVASDTVAGSVTSAAPYSVRLEDIERLLLSDRLGDLSEAYADRVTDVI